MQTFKSLIQDLGGGNALAAALREHLNVEETCLKDVSVRAWAMRDSIPSKYWLPIEEIARSRKLKHITVAKMAQLACQPRQEAV